jgi:hypothetical protein
MWGGGMLRFRESCSQFYKEELQHFVGYFPFQVFHSGRFVSNNLTLQQKPQVEAQVMYLQNFVFIEKVLHDIHLICMGTSRSHCVYKICDSSLF